MHDDAARMRIERLRTLRTPNRPDPSLGGMFDAAGRSLERDRRRSGGVGAAWGEACPARLVEKTAVRGLSRGVLTVAVRDASTRFEVDRWLRSGGLDSLIAASPAAVRRVKLTLESI